MKKISAVLLGLILYSCSSKSDDPNLTKTQLLTQHAWKFSSVTSNDPTTQLLLSLLLSNSEYAFKSAGTLTLTVPGLGDSPGTWEFADNETKIIFEKGTADENTSEIITLDGTNLELKSVSGSITTNTRYVKK